MPDIIDATELVELEKQSMALTTDPQFIKFLNLKAELDSKVAEARARIQDAMKTTNTKKISGDWGYITLVERTLFDIDLDLLPRGYKKIVPDTKKIGDHYKLTGKPIKGTEPKVSTSLRIGIK